MECHLFVKWIYLAIALSGFDSSAKIDIKCAFFQVSFRELDKPKFALGFPDYAGVASVS